MSKDIFGEKLKAFADLVIEDIDGEGKAKDFLKAKIKKCGGLKIFAQDDIQRIISDALNQKKLNFEALDLICCELKIKVYKNWIERIFDKIKYLIRDKTDVEVAEAYAGIDLFHSVFKGKTIKNVYANIVVQKTLISVIFSACVDRILTNASKNVQEKNEANFEKKSDEKKDKPMKIDTVFVKILYSVVEFFNRKIYIVDQKNWNHVWKNFFYSGAVIAAAMSLLRTHKITFKR